MLIKEFAFLFDIRTEKLTGAMSKKTLPRFRVIDQLRALAIALMIAYHFYIDGVYFGALPEHEASMWFFPKVIISLFYFTAGFSLALRRERSASFYPGFWKWWVQLVLGAGFISVFTRLLFPASWIYFGTLHCAAACAILSLPVLRRPGWALAVSAGVFAAYQFGGVTIPLYRAFPNTRAYDYEMVIPYLAPWCLGIAACSDRGKSILAAVDGTGITRHRAEGLMEFASRNTLTIYFIQHLVLLAAWWWIAG